MFAGHAETVRQRGILKNTLLGSSLCTHPVHTIVIYGESSLPETGPLSTFFRQLGGRSKVLPESFGLWFFSAQNNLHAKETFWGEKFCSSVVPLLKLQFHSPEVKLIDCFISHWTSISVLISSVTHFRKQRCRWAPKARPIGCEKLGI